MPDDRAPYHDSDEREPFEKVKYLGEPGAFGVACLVKVLDEELIEDYGADRVVLKIPLGRKRQLALIHEIELNAAFYMGIKSLKAPNLCRYLGFNVFHGQPVMVMEYCSDGSLLDLLGKPGHQKRLPFESAVEIAQGILVGLAVIHGERILHRDIKPANILMAEGKIVKVADLGISTMLVSKDKATTTAGTYPYMSPEMWGREGASYTSDLWSVGVTLYEMVTGRWPFGNLHTPLGEMADLVRNERNAKACDICADVPVWLSDAIDVALTKRPSDRYATAEDMLEALKRRGQRPADFEKDAAEVKELLRSGETSGKLEAAVRGLAAKFPMNAQTYHYLGQFYNRCQLRREAAEAFEKGIGIDDANALLHWDLGLVYQGMGRRDEALKHVEKAVALDLDPELKRHAVTLLRALRGGVSTKGIRSTSADDFEKDLANIREMLTSEECHDKAAAGLQELIRKYPNRPEAYLHLGEFHNRNQMHTQAVDAFKKGVEIDPQNALLHWDLALAYQRSGRNADAAKHLELALSLELDPGLRQHADRLLKALRSGRR